MTRVFSISNSSDKSNLVVCRNNQGADVPLTPSLHKHNISQMVFHKIRKEDLVIVRKPSSLSSHLKKAYKQS